MGHLHSPAGDLAGVVRHDLGALLARCGVYSLIQAVALVVAAYHAPDSLVLCSGAGPELAEAVAHHPLIIG